METTHATQAVTRLRTNSHGLMCALALYRTNYLCDIYKPALRLSATTYDTITYRLHNLYDTSSTKSANLPRCEKPRPDFFFIEISFHRVFLRLLFRSKLKAQVSNFLLLYAYIFVLKLGVFIFKIKRVE